MSYTVGQIIYLLSRKEIKVYPAQIVEEIKRKTISEEIVSYIIRLPDKSGTEVLIDEVSAEIFTSINDLEIKMVENAKAQIGVFLENAKNLESVFLPAKEESSAESIKDTKNIPEKKKRSRKKKTQEAPSGKVEIDLGNGLKASMSSDTVSNLNI